MSEGYKYLPVVYSVRLSHVQGSQIEARGIACAQELLLIQSVEQGDTEGVFAAVDTDGNARVDLRELATALAKWTLLVTKPESPLAAAKNLALDLYMIFDVDPLECAP
jgi:hypothetical protein